MKRIATMSLLVLAACSQAAEQDQLGNTANTQQSGHEALNPPPPGDPGRPRSDRIAEGATEPRSRQAAAQVLHRYFELIEAGQRGEAAKLWWDRAQAETFAARLDQFRTLKPNIAAPGRIEGAAGSLYVDVSLQLLGKLNSGEQSHWDAIATLRRANEVPGATADQRQWRIYRIAVQPAPRPTSYRFVGRWATEERHCANLAWQFTASSLRTPAGSVCTFQRVTEVPGGYDIASRCTAEGPPVNDVLKLRFAESARALLFESNVIADAGLTRCN